MLPARDTVNTNATSGIDFVRFALIRFGSSPGCVHTSDLNRE